MSKSNKIRLGLIFGGRSSEHEVSLSSARSVLEAISGDEYDVALICITPEGRWITGEKAKNLLEGKTVDISEDIILPQYPSENRLVAIKQDKDKNNARRLEKMDVVFPLLHGTYGEDGTIQGLLELAGLPYVGAGVAASGVGMDKIMMKELFRSRGLPVADFMHFLRKEWVNDQNNILSKIIETFAFPVFVKPSNAGSSIGITKVHNENELPAAIDYAAEFDRKILVERGISGREIECSVLGNDYPEASVPGEIIPSREFYDYEAKYTDEGSELIIPAQLSDKQTQRIRDLAVLSFKALDCAGMARVDLFLEHGAGKIYVNELNTIPGFTPISMYPKLWEASGISYKDLINRLIELAFERCQDLQNRRTTYTPKLKK